MSSPCLSGCGTDGASVNVSHQNAALPWLYCYVHWLELTCKNVFSTHLFLDIDDMLLRLYYVYEKKCCELPDLTYDLKEVIEFPDGGNLPMRAHGSHWITYKRKALQSC